MTRSQDLGSAYRANDSIASAFAAPVSTTRLAISTSAAAQGSLTQDATYRFQCDTDCFVLFADSGDATVTTGMPLTAGVPDWYTLNDISRISAITASGTGFLYITQCGE